jgi:hypothetical protein
MVIRVRLYLVLFGLAAAVLGVGVSSGTAAQAVTASPDALSASGCVGSGPYICEFYKSRGGVESDISDPLGPPPAVVNPGYVVVRFSSGPPISDRNNWAAVFLFSTTIGHQMFAWGCNTPGTPKSCFPSYATVTGGANAFILLDPDGTTTYVGGVNVYNLHLYKPISSGDKDHLSNLAAGLHADSALYHEILHLVAAIGPSDCAGVENLEDFLIAHHDHFSVKGLKKELAAVDEVEVLSC